MLNFSNFRYFSRGGALNLIFVLLIRASGGGTDLGVRNFSFRGLGCKLAKVAKPTGLSGAAVGVRGMRRRRIS
jgi:hypothetical protein